MRNVTCEYGKRHLYLSDASQVVSRPQETRPTFDLSSVGYLLLWPDLSEIRHFDQHTICWPKPNVCLRETMAAKCWWHPARQPAKRSPVSYRFMSHEISVEGSCRARHDSKFSILPSSVWLIKEVYSISLHWRHNTSQVAAPRRATWHVKASNRHIYQRIRYTKCWCRGWRLKRAGPV